LVTWVAVSNIRQTLDAWCNGLHEKSWIEGKNLIVEYRYAQSLDRFLASAAELIALTPDLDRKQP